MPRLPAWILLLAAIASPAPLIGQSSVSYSLDSWNFNLGGGPMDGQSPASISFGLAPTALGDIAGLNAVGANFQVASGMAGPYLQAGEVQNLRLFDPQTVIWDREPSADRYRVYRGLLSTLPGPYGTCFARGVWPETQGDPQKPFFGQGYFYLVTAVNLYGEEGVKGFDSLGNPNPNPVPCP